MQLAPAGPTISAKAAHAAVYDVLSNRMTVFGGDNGSGDTNDVWVLSNANGLSGTPTWTQLSPSGALPPVREETVAVYNPTANQMTIFSGRGAASYNDVWILTNANGAPLYSTCLLYDPTIAVKSGATIPIKLQLCNSSGSNLSSSSIVVHAISVTQVSTSISGLVEDSGNANPDNDFRYDSTLGNTGGYIFNLKTTGFTTGTYNLNFKAGNDPATYQASFQVK
jgi:hypothetical protein